MKNIVNDLLKASQIVEKSGIEEDVIGVGKSIGNEHLSVHVSDPESLLKLFGKVEVITREDTKYPLEIFVISEGIRFLTMASAAPNFLDPVGYELRDVHGKPVLKGEEYYLLGEDDCIVLVHIEDVAGYLKDERLRVENHEELMQLMELHYDAYPQIM